MSQNFDFELWYQMLTEELWWKEVMMTNFAKIDHDTGKVRKREDGKVLKPTGWVPPNLKTFV